MTRILLALLHLYRRFLSPALHALGPGGCKFQPTCSEYAFEAVARHGLWRGGWLSLFRIARCGPFGTSGIDRVPADLGAAGALTPWRLWRVRGETVPHEH